MKRNKSKHVVVPPALQPFQVEFNSKLFGKGGRNWSEWSINLTLWGKNWMFGTNRKNIKYYLEKGKINWSELNVTGGYF